MIGDPKSNNIIKQSLVPDNYTAGTYNGLGFDLDQSLSVTFIVSANTGVAGTINCKLQHSPDNTNWTDEIADDYGNDATIPEIIADGHYELAIMKPRTGNRYYRVVAVTAVNDVGLNIVAISGQKTQMDRVNL